MAYKFKFLNSWLKKHKLIIGFIGAIIIPAVAIVVAKGSNISLKGSHLKNFQIGNDNNQININNDLETFEKIVDKKDWDKTKENPVFREFIRVVYNKDIEEIEKEQEYKWPQFWEDLKKFVAAKENYRQIKLETSSEKIKELFSKIDGITEKNNYNLDEVDNLLNKFQEDEKVEQDIKDFAKVFFLKGDLYYLKGKYEEARYQFEKAVSLDTENALYLSEYADLLYTIKDYDKSLEYFEKLLPIEIKIRGENHPRIAKYYANLGAIYIEKEEFDKAMEFFDKAAPLYINAFGEDCPGIAAIYDNIGRIYNSKGEYDKAIRYHEKALEIFVAYFGENDSNVTITYANLGSVYLSMHNYDKAIEYFSKSIEIDNALFGENSDYLATTYDNIGAAYSEKHEYDKAIGYHEKALEIFLEYFGENHPDVAICYGNLGTSYAFNDNCNRAIGYFEKDLAILNKILPADDPEIEKVEYYIENCNALK